MSFLGSKLSVNIKDFQDKPLNKKSGLFTKEEIIIMDKVLNQLNNKSASQLTKWSHSFKGWNDTKDGEIINYSYAKNFELTDNW